MTAKTVRKRWGAEACTGRCRLAKMRIGGVGTQAAVQGGEYGEGGALVRFARAAGGGTTRPVRRRRGMEANTGRRGLANSGSAGLARGRQHREANTGKGLPLGRLVRAVDGRSAREAAGVPGGLTCAKRSDPLQRTLTTPWGRPTCRHGDACTHQHVEAVNFGR